MKIFLKNSAGFTVVGALTAATIGAISVLGLTQMSSNIVNNLSKSKKIFNVVTLSEEIRHAFFADRPPNPPCNPVTQDCFNSCSSSLLGISTAIGTDSHFAIRKPSPMTGPNPGSGTGGILFEGGQTHKGIKIQEIKYEPRGSNYGVASVHFSLSEDTRETLLTPQSLHFVIFVTSASASGAIEECVVSSSKISGSGLFGVGKNCRKVDGASPAGSEQTLLGCGGTAGNSASKAVAFGYKAGGDYDAAGGSGVFNSGAGNTFFGYEAGKVNTSGQNNVFLGYQSGMKNTTGNNNIFLGYQTGYHSGTDDSQGNTTGSDNILIGRQVVLSNSTDEKKFNIGNIIEGENLKTLTSTPLVYPKLTFKSPVTIHPENLPSPETATPEPSLSVIGKMEIVKKQATPPKAIMEAKGSNEMTLTVDTMELKKVSSPNSGATAAIKVEGTAADPELNIGADLEVASGGSTPWGPAITVSGHLELRSRDNVSKVNLQASNLNDQPRLNVTGGLIVRGAGTGSTSTIKDNVDIAQNLTTPTSKPGTTQFKKLEVTSRATFEKDVTITTLSGAIPRATITDALITDPTVTMGNVTLISVNEDSHIHPPHTHPEYALIGHNHGSCASIPACGCACSSRTLKRNIKPFKNYEKSLKDILKTPLFTYQYKKEKGDHPEKVRMGIISEEMPKDLQILEKDKPSTPDWLSIYGTLWAGIKALAEKWENLKKINATKITQLSKDLKLHFKNHITPLRKKLNLQMEGFKNQWKDITQAIQIQAQNSHEKQKEFSELKKQFQKAILTLKNQKREAKRVQTELKMIQKKIKEVEGI